MGLRDDVERQIAREAADETEAAERAPIERAAREQREAAYTFAPLVELAQELIGLGFKPTAMFQKVRFDQGPVEYLPLALGWIDTFWAKHQYDGVPMPDAEQSWAFSITGQMWYEGSYEANGDDPAASRIVVGSPLEPEKYSERRAQKNAAWLLRRVLGGFQPSGPGRFVSYE